GYADLLEDNTTGHGLELGIRHHPADDLDEGLDGLQAIQRLHDFVEVESHILVDQDIAEGRQFLQLPDQGRGKFRECGQVAADLSVVVEAELAAGGKLTGDVDDGLTDGL